jgi:hypothetical protein
MVFHFKLSGLLSMIFSLQWVKYKAASTTITEGEIEDCFYITIVGKVLVRKQGN